MRAYQRWLWPWVSFLAISQDIYAVPETVFDQQFESQILPAFWTNGSSAFLTAADELKIHYRAYVKPGQKRALVILPGRTESTFKFAEFLHDIQDLNLAVFIMDHRGQGASGREVKDTQIQYVRDFSFYRDDLTLFMKEKVAPHGFNEIYALGHSMGANILALTMVQNPVAFKKVVMSAPMFEIKPAPFPFQWMAYSLASMACWLGWDKSFVPGHGPYRADELYRGTSSSVRFKGFNRLRAEKKLEQVGGVSYRFAQKALEASSAAQGDAEQLMAPILMFQAAKDDVVLSGGQDYVCQRAKNCRKIVLANAQHELHLEVDAIRDPWLQEIRQFFSNP